MTNAEPLHVSYNGTDEVVRIVPLVDGQKLLRSRRKQLLVGVAFMEEFCHSLSSLAMNSLS